DRPEPCGNVESHGYGERGDKHPARAETSSGGTKLMSTEESFHAAAGARAKSTCKCRPSLRRFPAGQGSVDTDAGEVRIFGPRLGRSAIGSDVHLVPVNRQPIRAEPRHRL